MHNKDDHQDDLNPRDELGYPVILHCYGFYLQSVADRIKSKSQRPVKWEEFDGRGNS